MARVSGSLGGTMPLQKGRFYGIVAYDSVLYFLMTEEGPRDVSSVSGLLAELAQRCADGSCVESYP